MSIITATSCNNPEKEALKTVDDFLKQVNNEVKLDSTKIDKSLTSLVRQYGCYLSKDGWTLNVSQRNDTAFFIESIGKTHNGLGKPIEIKQKFSLKKARNGWKIFDTYNLIPLFLDMDIVDRNWNFFWDIEKNNILLDLEKNLKLEVLQKGRKAYSNESVEGKLRLSNNSEYDITDVTILIEHFDADGKSVNTNEEYVPDIIRKNGYREFNWFAADCSKCFRQEFKIKFQREY